MKETTRVLFIILFISIASGCAGRPVFSLEVYGTPTPYEQYPDSPTGTPYDLNIPGTVSPAAPISPLAEYTQTPVMPPSDFSPILYGKKYDANTFFLLLGGVQAGKWLTPEQAAALIPGTSEYDIHTPNQDTFQVLGYAPESTPIRPGQYTIGSDSTQDAFGMLGVANGWPVRQGQVEELSPESELYRQAVLNWLSEAGIPDPLLDTLHIFRVDLEGDGADEVFISANRLDPSLQTSQAGDYSIILMRKVAGNEAITLPLVADVYHSPERKVDFPRAYSLANFMDLNQDGILEVIVDYHQWEQDGALVYTIQGKEVRQVP